MCSTTILLCTLSIQTVISMVLSRSTYYDTSIAHMITTHFKTLAVYYGRPPVIFYMGIIPEGWS